MPITRIDLQTLNRVGKKGGVMGWKKWIKWIG